MEREQALLIVKQQLTEQRYEHTLGVVETAVKLAKQYGADAKNGGTGGDFPRLCQIPSGRGNETNHFGAKYAQRFACLQQ